MNRQFRPAAVCSALLVYFALFAPLREANAGEGAKPEEFINKILAVNDKGAEPMDLTIERRGSLVFFRNDTEESLINIEIDYGSRRAYCSTGRMGMGEDGIVRSFAPLQPGNFATVCFPDAGTYDVKFFGVRGTKGPVLAKISVQ